jgi:hypothetical protein
MAARAKRTGRRPVAILLAFLVGVPLAWAPMVVRGLAAQAWVAHYAALDSLPRPRKASAREVAARVDSAVWNLAPLPQAPAAAILALDLGQRLEQKDHDPEAALVIYQGVRATCARVRERALSGAGFAVIEARAMALAGAVRLENRK